MVSLALYQPDIPQNVGATMRVCACLNVPLHIIEPCGFPWDESKMKRAGMDYMGHAALLRHESWNKFLQDNIKNRIILMTTHAPLTYINFKFEENDILLAGRESAGAPENIHESAAERIAIPMEHGLRSMNIVNASAMILGEALRQTKWSKA